MKKGGTMPECPECHNRGRHKMDCSHKRRSSPRSSLSGTRADVFLERLREKIKEAPDGVLAACLRVCMEEADARRQRIEDEARERIRMLDEVLPKQKTVVVGSPPPTVQAIRGDVHPAPSNMQCPAVHPENMDIKCTQPKMHEGQHYNHQHKKSWQRRAV